MSDLIEFVQGFHVNVSMDHDDELEVCVENHVTCAWMTRRQVRTLIAHLNAVLGDADREQETES